jgi:hypothetical protein
MHIMAFVLVITGSNAFFTALAITSYMLYNLVRAYAQLAFFLLQQWLKKFVSSN